MKEVLDHLFLLLRTHHIGVEYDRYGRPETLWVEENK